LLNRRLEWGKTASTFRDDGGHPAPYDKTYREERHVGFNITPKNFRPQDA